ncbi:MAG: Hsp20/alpha crystallin family protein [Verrucomicrobiota bacterium]
MNSTASDNCNSNTVAQAAPRTWRRPAYDVSENADAFNLEVSLPGVSRDGVDISVEDDTLQITGTRTGVADNGWQALRRELPAGDYRLSLRLNVEVNEAKIKARVENGVLELTLPKADAAKLRKIKVS